MKNTESQMRRERFSHLEVDGKRGIHRHTDPISLLIFLLDKESVLKVRMIRGVSNLT
jgi:hypothetical protein